MIKDTNIKSIDSKEFFVEFLNTEIEQLREDIKTPGWTVWAIVAALASIIWLLILEIEKKAFDFDQTLLLFLLLYFAYSFFRQIYDLFKRRRAHKKIQYSTFTEILNGQRLLLLFGIAMSIVIILL